MNRGVIEGDCIEQMAAMPDASVHAIVTDPPYGLSREPDITEVLQHWLAGDDYKRRGGGFMGQTWDSFVPGPAVWREAHRVLKPGGHLLAFAGSRTCDLMGMAIRLAGLEIRDSLLWLYGSGFPKSLDVSKAIDKAAGAERKTVGRKPVGWGGLHANERLNDDGWSKIGAEYPEGQPITAPATPEAEQWQGWGTALKPAHEPIVVARKPLDGTVAANVQTHGTGALNIDATRISADGRHPAPTSRDVSRSNGADSSGGTGPSRGASLGSRSRSIDSEGGSASQPAHRGHPRPNGCECDPPETPPQGSPGDCPACRRSDDESSRPAEAGDPEVAPPQDGALELPAPDGAASGSPSSQPTAPAEYTVPDGRWPANIILSHTPLCEPVGVRTVKGDPRDTGAGERPGGFADVGAENGDGEPNAPVYGDEEVVEWDCAPGCPVAALDAQSGELSSGALTAAQQERGGFAGTVNAYGTAARGGEREYGANSGGASRFFYCAKTSRAERNAGLEGFEERKPHDNAGHVHADERAWDIPGSHSMARANHHPTVKPISLMRWLCRLVTPPDGLVLDPFAGSGSTGCAAALEGFAFVGIEKESEYAEIARARIAFWAQHEGREVEDVLRMLGNSERQRRAHEDLGQGVLDVEAAA